MNFTRELRRGAQKLPVRLNEEELRQKGDELAATCQEISHETADQETIKRQLKAKLAELEARRDNLAALVSSKRDYRDVEVSYRLGDDGTKVQETRIDTGEILIVRAAQDLERQGHLPDIGRVAHEVAEAINAGALGLDVSATEGKSR